MPIVPDVGRQCPSNEYLVPASTAVSPTNENPAISNLQGYLERCPQLAGRTFGEAAFYFPDATIFSLVQHSRCHRSLLCLSRTLLCRIMCDQAGVSASGFRRVAAVQRWDTWPMWRNAVCLRAVTCAS